MGEVSTIGLDIAKSVFQIHGVDAAGAVVMRKRILHRHPRCDSSKRASRRPASTSDRRHSAGMTRLARPRSGKSARRKFWPRSVLR